MATTAASAAARCSRWRAESLTWRIRKTPHIGGLSLPKTTFGNTDGAARP
jgi:hypothetical protein